MINQAKVQADLTQSTLDFVRKLQNFPDEALHNKPTPNRWSAAEIAAHVILLEEMINTLLVAPATTTPDRAIDQKVAHIKSVFLNFEQKLSAPPLIHPPTTPQNKKQLIQKMMANRQQLAEIINEHDLSLQCSGFKHALFGAMTRLEWVYFNIYHSKRHKKQITNLMTTK